MILLCNGDSWTQGDSPAQTFNWEAKPNLDWYNIMPNFGEPTIPCDDRITYKFYDSDVWPKVLGEKLGVETWNCGRLGSSNDKIVRTTINSIEYLESLGKSDIFVVIGLTSINRYSNIITKNFKYYYEEERQHSNRVDNILVKKDLVNLINIQNYLSMKGYDYLIFNTFDGGMETDFKKYKLYDNIDLNHIYNKDFKPHFLSYIEKTFNTEWGDESDYFKKSHPTDKSHIEWGNELHKYIKENYNV
jgi:hypothetical protein